MCGAWLQGAQEPQSESAGDSARREVHYERCILAVPGRAVRGHLRLLEVDHRDGARRAEQDVFWGRGPSEGGRRGGPRAPASESGARPPRRSWATRRTRSTVVRRDDDVPGSGAMRGLERVDERHRPSRAEPSVRLALHLEPGPRADPAWHVHAEVRAMDDELCYARHAGDRERAARIALNSILFF